MGERSNAGKVLQAARLTATNKKLPNLTPRRQRFENMVSIFTPQVSYSQMIEIIVMVHAICLTLVFDSDPAFLNVRLISTLHVIPLVH